jgi:hypothetical protein
MNNDDPDLDMEDPQDDDPDISAAFGAPVADPPADPNDSPGDTPEIRAIKAEAQRDALREENTRLERFATERPAPTSQGAPAPAAPPKRKLVPDNFVQKFAENADTAMAEFADNVERVVEERVSQRSTPGAVAQGMALVSSFLRDKRDADPEEYAVAQKAFNTRIAALKSQAPEAFANLVNMPPAQFEYSMDIEWNAAYGIGAREQAEQRKRDAATRRSPAPSPGLGGSRGGGGTTPASRPAGGKQLSPYETALVQRAQKSGLSYADCMDLVRQDRAERRAAQQGG